MNLRDYIRIGKKRWLTIAVLALVGTTLGLAYALTASPVYTAQTQVVVSAQQSQNATTDELVQGASYSRNQVATYVQLVTQPLILQPVIAKLGLAVSSADLAKHVSASSPVNTTIVNVQVDYGDPTTAADIANATADSMRETIQEMETPIGSTTPRVKITTSSKALPPATPSSPRLGLDVVLGLLGGLVIGVTVAVLREVLDTRVKDPQDLERITSTSVIGVVPDPAAGEPDPLIIHSNSNSPRAEAFRKLRTNLRFVDFESHPKSIVVTSSLPGEAKTTTSINLASSFASAGLRVCLVEADLRRPRVGRYLGLEESVGLTTVLIGQINLGAALQPVAQVPSLHVLTAGQVPPNPAEWLGSASMSSLVRSLEQQYDMVVVDSPPLLPVTDAAVLAAIANGVLLVAGAGKVDQADVERSIATLESVDAKLLGMVMTFVKRRQFDAYGGAYVYGDDALQDA